MLYFLCDKYYIQINLLGGTKMKLYIRYFDKKSFWNFALKGKVFFYQRRFGFYAMKESPTIYLKELSQKITSLSIIKPDASEPIFPYGSDYYDVNENDIIKLTYFDGSFKAAEVKFDSFYNTYYYAEV